MLARITNPYQIIGRITTTRDRTEPSYMDLVLNIEDEDETRKQAPGKDGIDTHLLFVGFFESAGADVWSPQNPDGKILAMIMIEDASAVEVAAAIADTPGYSVLACGIGSLTGAMGGDRDAGEAGCMAVLAEGNRVGVYNMMTAMTPESAIDRIERGYLGILSFPSDQYEAMVQAGRDAEGR